MKKEIGITLIALVVTVIVLMILAGITLTLVLGQNGIIGKAKEAKAASTNAEIETGEGINNLSDEINKKIGQTTPVCNIYDMGENEWEWTTEAYNDPTYCCVIRGGYCCYSNHAEHPAGSRYPTTLNHGFGDMGFRITLYL